jgi:hypothetical protein
MDLYLRAKKRATFGAKKNTTFGAKKITTLGAKKPPHFCREKY